MQKPSERRGTHRVAAWMTVALLWFVGGLNHLDRVMIATLRPWMVDAIPMTGHSSGRCHR